MKPTADKANPEVIERLGFVTDSLLYETVATPSGLQYATSEGRTILQFEERNAVVSPPHGLQPFVAAKCLAFPSEAVRGVSAEELAASVKEFIWRYADIPESWTEPILAYVLMTWVYDRFSSLPYLRFLGEPGTGKTRMLKTISALCFRPLKVSGNITGAGLFRTIDLIRGTLAVDEADFKNSKDWSDITKVFNNGYSDGFPIIRCAENNKFAPQPFVVFGPKIISTRHRFEDAATEERCLTFETAERKLDPRIPLQLPAQFYREAEDIRNKLLGWRFDNFHRIQPDDSRLRNLAPRMGEVGSSLLAVTPNPDSIVEFLNGYANAAKEDSPKEVLREILAETKTLQPLKAITARLNEQLDSDLSCEVVGPMVRSLGRTVKRKKAGRVVYPLGVG